MSASKFCCFDDYKKWVITNPERLSQLETTGRFISYLIAGRIKTSPAFSELLYSASNIIIFLNDQILLSATRQKEIGRLIKTNLEKFRVLFTILEYLQVFLEITATKIWGSHGKWTAITIIQSIKCLWRIVLLSQKSGLATSRSIPPLNRKKLKQNNLSDWKTGSDERHNSLTFSLKSGRVIRQVNGAPHINKRNWKLPVSHSFEINDSSKTKLEGYSLLGEVLYTLKPLCHLAAMSRFGTKSWIPTSLAFVTDIVSITLVKSSQLSSSDAKEIQRRQLTLLMYLLRSPIYDRFSRNVILQILTSLRKIPLIGVLPHQILQYMLFWQNVYFYTWD
ncbi:peroxisomal membrane protein PEX16-like [Daphnia pulicaria]|uniref:peroxisomal membrane protein PEX16-like n=1 Tax=Daphnia pulicaria TaxID=35523 RepID=UPI001EEC2914|nr:peroxisomal membrane protein PEX16-like [Daphnia pulicaria]